MFSVSSLQIIYYDDFYANNTTSTTENSTTTTNYDDENDDIITISFVTAGVIVAVLAAFILIEEPSFSLETHVVVMVRVPAPFFDTKGQDWETANCENNFYHLQTLDDLISNIYHRCGKTYYFLSFFFR